MGGRLEKTEKYTRELAMGLDSESVPDDKEKILSSDDDMDDEDLCQLDAWLYQRVMKCFITEVRYGHAQFRSFVVFRLLKFDRLPFFHSHFK